MEDVPMLRSPADVVCSSVREKMTSSRLKHNGTYSGARSEAENNI